MHADGRGEEGIARVVLAGAKAAGGSPLLGGWGVQRAVPGPSKEAARQKPSASQTQDRATGRGLQQASM